MLSAKTRLAAALLACCALAGCASTDFAQSSSPATIKEQFTRKGAMTWGGSVLSSIDGIKTGDAKRVERTYTVNPGATVLEVSYLGHRHGPSATLTKSGFAPTFTQTKPVEMRATLAPGGHYQLDAWAEGDADTVSFSLVDLSSGRIIASTVGIPVWIGPEGTETEFGVSSKVAVAFASASSCCRSPGEFSYQPLPTRGTLSAKIGSNGPLFAFKTGRSYFLAYALPRTGRPLSIVVKSWFHGSVFFPRLLLLDESFAQTRLIGPPAARYVPPALLEGGHIEVACSLGTDDPARYLVILTTDADLRGRVHTTSQPTMLFSRNSPIYVPGGHYAADFGPTGDLTITLSGPE